MSLWQIAGFIEMRFSSGEKYWRLHRKKSAAALAVDSTTNEAALEKLLARPGRGAMFGHLVWQQWRQSGWAIFLLAGLAITLVEAIGWNFEWNWKNVHNVLAWNVIGAIALLGCFVFRADQARHQFRFFIEHNVPPRYVWLSRQVPWLMAFSIAVFVIVIGRFGTQNLHAVLNTFSATSDWQRNYAINQFDPGVASEILAHIFVRGDLLCGRAMDVDDDPQCARLGRGRRDAGRRPLRLGRSHAANGHELLDHNCVDPACFAFRHLVASTGLDPRESQSRARIRAGWF